MPPPGNATAFTAVVVACWAWNVLVFTVLARRMFPNFWVARGGALAADALGHR
jgi:hypothetical protein